MIYIVNFFVGLRSAIYHGYSHFEILRNELVTRQCNANYNQLTHHKLNHKLVVFGAIIWINDARLQHHSNFHSLTRVDDSSVWPNTIILRECGFHSKIYLQKMYSVILRCYTCSKHSTLSHKESRRPDQSSNIAFKILRHFIAGRS